MKVLGNLERSCKRGPDAWFTGMVWMDEVSEPTPPARAQAVLVAFAPGARTAWHTHPLGQTLYIFSGIGWAQEKGQQAHVVRAGDVVVIEPGEVHWHGAEEAHTMTHFAMQEMDDSGRNVVWGSAVTGEEYGAVNG